jgi:hypothetical protein
MSSAQNIAVARQLLAGIGESLDPDRLGEMFSDDLLFEIQGDDGVLPWIGRKTGREAAADFFRQCGS